MSRSKQFLAPARLALVDHPEATLNSVRGPMPHFNPTRARFDFAQSDLQAAAARATADPRTANPPSVDNVAQVEWRSRDNRKGRHVLIVPKDDTSAPELSTSWPRIRHGLWRMCTVMAWWDVSWWIAVLFSIGSAIFVISGFFYWLPLAAPWTEFKNESGIGGGLTAFIGATLFTIGGVLLIVEACNENQTGCFGWALEQAFKSHHSDSDNDAATPINNGNESQTQLISSDCKHHHRHGVHRRSNLKLQHPSSDRKWEWWPTWHELTSHYFHEIGWWASIILAIGAIIFYVSGIMALPWIYNGISKPVLWGTYWLAYLLGGVLFVVSSVLYVLETQPTFYTPAPRLIGWWIGVWNLIGSIGWTLSAAFGYCSPSWCAYQSDLSLLWASIAFLIGSMLLWYESLDKYVVERAR